MEEIFIKPDFGATYSVEFKDKSYDAIYVGFGDRGHTFLRRKNDGSIIACGSYPLPKGGVPGWEIPVDEEFATLRLTMDWVDKLHSVREESLARDLYHKYKKR